MRSVSGFALVVLACAASAGADDKKVEKIDGTKLVGKWETKKESKLALEFTKDGKLIVTEKDFKGEGRYKLEGDKLTIQMKVGENAVDESITILKLTADEMEIESEGDKKKESFKRVKAK